MVERAQKITQQIVGKRIAVVLLFHFHIGTRVVVAVSLQSDGVVFQLQLLLLAAAHAQVMAAGRQNQHGRLIPGQLRHALLTQQLGHFPQHIADVRLVMEGVHGEKVPDGLRQVHRKIADGAHSGEIAFGTLFALRQSGILRFCLLLQTAPQPFRIDAHTHDPPLCFFAGRHKI